MTIMLSFIGLDFITALSIASGALLNVGQGSGQGCIAFADLPNLVKFLLSVTMLIGHLELLSVLVLFLPSFWKA